MSEKKQKGHDYSTLLIWSAAVVTVVRYAAAFIASDMGEITGWLSEAITLLMGLSGLGMGILDVIGGTYLFDGWRRAMPAANAKTWSSRFKVLSVFVFSLMGTGVMILVPFAVSRVTHESMETVLGSGIYLNFWALLVNVAPYLLIGGVAVGTQVVNVAESAPESYRKVSAEPSEATAKFPTDWRKVRRMLNEQQVSGIADSSSKIISDLYGVDERTARNWRKYARQERETATTTSEVGADSVNSVK